MHTLSSFTLRALNHPSARNHFRFRAACEAKLGWLFLSFAHERSLGHAVARYLWHSPSVDYLGRTTLLLFLEILESCLKNQGVFVHLFVSFFDKLPVDFVPFSRVLGLFKLVPPARNVSFDEIEPDLARLADKLWRILFDTMLNRFS